MSKNQFGKSSTITSHGVTKRAPENSQNDDRKDKGQNESMQSAKRLLFAPLNTELFNSVAKEKAQMIAENDKANKPSQIRKFYDELCMWENKVSLEPTRFNDYLPFILMLNAKLAYAKGRRLVDDNFTKLIGDCLQQVKDPETLRICKLFFEAFLGFYKELRPSDK